MTAPITVERVLDEEHSIVITIDPDHVVDALATRLAGMHGPMMLMRQLDADHPQRAEARRKIVHTLGSITLQVTVDRAGALALVEDLEVAAREPVSCAVGHCGSLADDDYCDRHLDAGAGDVRRAG